MSEEQSHLKQMLERREREYMLGKARVKVRSSVENLDVGDYRVDKLSEGETTEVPRWVADELAGMSLVDVVEEPFEVEIFKALSREKMMGPMQLSALPADFYVKMRRRLTVLSEGAAAGRVKKEELDRLRGGSYDIIGMRLSKLLSISSSSTPASALADRLTPEETAFFGESQVLSKEWKSALLGSVG